MERLRARICNLVYKVDCPTGGGSWVKDAFRLDYEEKKYRQDELTKVIVDALPHFALTPQEFEALRRTGDVGEIYRQSWGRISKAKKNKKGDYGEILLFILLKFFYSSERFVTKVRLRTNIKEQVKGFDCAHFTIEEGDKIFLWLGEAKFHKSFSTAISSAFGSIEEHLCGEYLRDELTILGSNIEVNEGTIERDLIDSIINGGVSLDRVNIRMPILVTYDSPVVAKHEAVTELFIDELSTELKAKFLSIDSRGCAVRDRVELVFLVLPLEVVDGIKEKLDKIELLSR